MTTVSEKADIIVKSNVLFDGVTDPKPGALAISGNKVLALGEAKDVENLIDRDTRIYEFEDQLVMPGFHDSHVHVIFSGLYEICVNLKNTKSEEEAAKLVGEFAKKTPNTHWVLGFSWFPGFWESGKMPTRDSLDRYISDRPVFLLNYEGHSCWVNSKALEVCHINENTEDPAGGKVLRDESGQPTGVLLEGAMSLVSEALALSHSQQEKILKKLLSKAASCGVISIRDMQLFLGQDFGDLSVYNKLEENGELTARLHAYPGLDGNLEKVLSLREKYNSDKIKVSGLKQFLDGVPATYTAFLCEPYSDKPQTRGKPAIDPDYLKELVVNADKENFAVSLHACGDGAVRMGLDAIETARKANGKKDTRHSIEHIEVIHPEDIKRFAELGVVASMQPEHIISDKFFKNHPYPSRLGPKRIRYTWAFRTLLKHNVKIVFGSDCPVVDLNPMPGIFRAVTRVHDDGEPKGGWNPEEKLSVKEALHAYTAEPAYVVKREHELGVLRPGNFADIIALDKNLFNIPVQEIPKTKVILTIMDGRVVFED